VQIHGDILTLKCKKGHWIPYDSHSAKTIKDGGGSCLECSICYSKPAGLEKEFILNAGEFALLNQPDGYRIRAHLENVNKAIKDVSYFLCS
jgi:NAD-dependent SIR2 family protein deacetylase